jgi:2,3-bisphosphoglycerate-independent phosphoglycerate mutase
MISSDYTRNLFVADSDARIVMLVIDGLGGLPRAATGRSELETANLPHLDALCARGSSGLISPLGPGFTPGSGPAHIALFGYDPWTTNIGRGALSNREMLPPDSISARLAMTGMSPTAVPGVSRPRWEQSSVVC